MNMEIKGSLTGRIKAPDFSGFKIEPVDTVALAAHLEQWKAAFQALGRSVTKAMRSFRRAWAAHSAALRAAANGEVNVAGLSARYYVRGGTACRMGLDDLDTLVMTLLRDPGSLEEDEPWTHDLLTPANRARVAAQAIAGYVDGDWAGPEGMLYWRTKYSDGTTVTVVRGK